jgi:hypothetical protein
MSNNVISYLEFRRAAIRNISVCEILLNNYPTEKSGNQKQLLYKTFYLAGYVVEFLYKYSLFSHLNLANTECVYKYRNAEFQKKWKVHNFDQLYSLCEDEGLIFSADIPYLGHKLSDKNLTLLMDAWDVQIRYSMNLSRKKISLSYEDLSKFIKMIKIINTKVNAQYP